uniref:Uncharacterized protein n=1 Tax=Anguilla anguilla TaxID=7936 RepID=A0A0E9QFN7_ANGAN
MFCSISSCLVSVLSPVLGCTCVELGTDLQDEGK